MDLPQAFVDSGANDSGDVQRALALGHGQAEYTFRLTAEYRIRQANRLFSEHKVVTRCELGIEHEPAGSAAEIPPTSLGIRVFVGVAIKRSVCLNTQPWPVVKAGSSAGLLRKIKSDGLNQVQPAPGGDARTPDVARVIGDLGLVEDDLEHAISRQRG